MSTLHSLTWGDAGSRVLFLHGLFGQGRNWTTIGKALSENHRVTALDLPQHGRSPWRPRFDYIEMADEVAKHLESSGPSAVVGHSLGGKVAMLLALRRPDLVERLGVVDMSPVTYDRVGQFEHLVTAMRGLDLSALTSRGQADEQLAHDVPDAGVRGFLLQNLRRDGDGWRWQMNLDVLGDSLSQIGGWPADRLDGVPPYDGPVIWIAGSDSDYVAPEYDAAMSQYFPRERLVTIKDSGHWVHSEQPQVFTDVVARFLG